MIGLVILGQEEFANGLVKAAEHVFGKRPPALEAAGIDYAQPPERIAELVRARIVAVDQGDGVLILADVYGTTHTNVACRLLEHGRVELVSGANLPMLLRTLTYRQLAMNELIDRALSGGTGGIVCASNRDLPGEGRS
jgi:mannose PTS system EIIA component